MLKEIETILSEVKPYNSNPGHHMGLPFMSAYQIAIELKKRFPSEFQDVDSLPRTVGKTLSQAILKGDCHSIEGGFISHTNIKEMSFADGRQILNNEQSAHSIFRYVGL